MIPVEGAQGADRLIEGAGPEAPLVLQVDQEVEDALGAEGREIGVRIVSGELLDPAVVSSARALCETFELDETGEALIPLGRSDCVMFFS